MAGVGPLNPPSIDRPPLGNGSSNTPGAAPGAPASGAVASGVAGPALGMAAQASNSAAAPWLDQADIRVLDIAGALQILLFEVSDALDFVQPAGRVQGADEAAGLIVDAFLQKLPDADPVQPGEPAELAWIGAVDRLQAALESGLDRALCTVGAWRGVAEEVIAAITVSRAIITAALVDEPAPEFLLRPEWLGLAPRIERYRRRRRALRRRLLDPDDRMPR